MFISIFYYCRCQIPTYQSAVSSYGGKGSPCHRGKLNLNQVSRRLRGVLVYQADLCADSGTTVQGKGRRKNGSKQKTFKKADMGDNMQFYYNEEVHTELKVPALAFVNTYSSVGPVLKSFDACSWGGMLRGEARRRQRQKTLHLPRLRDGKPLLCCLLHFFYSRFTMQG